MSITKHMIVGRFGTSGGQPISPAVGERVTELNFLSPNGSLGRGVGRALKSLQALDLYPTERGIEVLLLSILVYAADTRISRATESEDGWTRQIRLVMPVKDPATWEGASASLKPMLDFLTGDRWEVEFVQRLASVPSLSDSTPSEWESPGYDGVSLFSGGMDSLIGAIDELAEGRRPLLVGHAGDSATSKAQSECVSALEEQYGDRKFSMLRFWLQIESKLIPAVRREDTTRSRSFLFIAAAAAAGSGTRAPFDLRVPENGLIALNVPLDPNRVGALSTRTTHPYYLAAWQELLRGIGVQASIINPYSLRTKGEMAAKCENFELLLSLLPKSMSCSSPNKGRWRKLGIQHCGYCLPCIIRRASIGKALGDPSKDPTKYTYDLRSGFDKASNAVARQARSFLFAIGRLRHNPEISRFLVLKTGPLPGSPEERDALAGVYLRGMLEVGDFLEPSSKAKP